MPAVVSPPVESPTADTRPANVFKRLFEGGQFSPVNRMQLEPYLAESRRSAESLVAAFRVTGVQTLLQEAAELSPHDPRVAFAVWCTSESPEEQRHWLDAFKRAAPDNALANYLSAQDCFQSGQTDQAVDELVAAGAQSKFQDYAAEFVQNVEEACRAAGYSAAEAKAVAAYDSLPLPHLSRLRDLGSNLNELASLYRMKTSGESEALRWVMNRQGNP
jgi:hypothetical protein